MGVRETLAAMEGAWAATPPAERGGDLPAGKYQVQLGLSKSGNVVSEDQDGGIRARVALTVVAASDTELVGRKTSKSWNIAKKEATGMVPDERGQSYLKADLQILGVALPKLSDVGQAFMSVMGAVVDAQVVHKTDATGMERVNIYFNALASPGAAKPAAGKSAF